MILIRENGCQIIKLMASFPIGRNWEYKRGLIQSVASMMKKSTAKHSNTKLQKLLDHYSIQIEVYSTPTHVVAELHSHIQFISSAIPVFLEILFEAKFMKSQWDLVRRQIVNNISQQHYQTDYWADKMLSEHLFGEHHPLGYYSQPDDYAKIELANIQEFYQRYIATTLPHFYLAGDALDIAKKSIEECIKSYSLTKRKNKTMPAPLSSKPIELNKQMGDAHQASVRLGKLIYRQGIEDFCELELWNCFLGGHYMSELMKKLRIEKGYTYGIYSTLTHYPQLSYVQIAYETDKKQIGASLSVINDVFQRFYKEKNIDLTEARKQCYSQWAKNAERSLHLVMYRMKLDNLGYNYSQYANWLSQYQEKTISKNSTIQKQILDINSYSKSIVY